MRRNVGGEDGKKSEEGEEGEEGRRISDSFIRL